MISLKFLVTFLAGLFSFFSFLLPAPAPYGPKEPELRLSAAVLSDMHIGPRNPILQHNVNKAFRNASGDALVLLGDNTMDGMEQQYALFYAALKAYGRAGQNIVAVGNHDLWGMGSYTRAKERFISYYNEFSGGSIDKLNYCKIINGYSFIVMGTESDMGTNAHITDAQVEWLDARLAEATAGGKPAFVFNHFPINRVHAPERLSAVLSAYPNVFYFFGHMHHALGSGTFQKVGESLYYIDVPGFNGAEDDIFKYLGHGLQIEVYDSKVILRARDYIRGQWLKEHVFSADLV